ncbi:centrosomal protein of 97 kDa-like isoform X2 [Salvelinus fontinalis]|uniref:centrosomal protein of 97 kDa-like isoform X2 n=1 Tax=Salvelinus fontinalis TaxID=8038 RepID=UPI002485BE71|nr:centrosomal protein of 97 kDa-like isoform X2 [Salvelinus fontinalis]
MGVSDLTFDTTGPVRDLSLQGLQKLEPSFTCSDETHTLILDRNHIMKLDHLERSRGLQQLSVAGNRLVRMMGVCRLTELRVLNLPNNSIGYIEGLRDLPHLEWLNLSGNNIKVIEQLNSCVALQHLDVSDNNISNIGDLTKLLALKTLLLHGNSITTLRTVPTHLPAHLSILSLAENEIRDLNEVSYLAPLHDLEQLSIMSNPCIMATPSLPGYDYRPYIMSWCLNLKILDGYLVSQKEGLKAEWLYSQGKGRSYRPGQHVQLVQYLATVCPLTSTSTLETAEDAKLEKILSKQRFHQRQLQQQTQGGSPSPPRPTQLDVETHSPCHVPPLGGAREADRATTPVTASPARQTEPAILQINTWLGCEASQAGAPPLRGPRGMEDRLYLEDVQSQTDEDKLTGSLLSSESTFLPVTSDPARSDSEDETETFEPDSLAPEHPIRPKKTFPEKTQHAPLEREMENRVKEVTGERVSADSPLTCTLTSTASPPVTAGDQSQTNDSAPLQGAYSNCVAADVRVGSKQEEEVVLRCDRLGRCEADRAAVRIQAWWRGMWARRSHPLAKEVRCEIRLRRMQEHIIFLSGELERVRKHHEEERLQRLVQEEAVNFLWGQLQYMQQWQRTVEAQLASVAQAGSSPAPALTPGLCGPPALRLPLPVAFSTADAACTDLSFPDSGFQFTGEQQARQEDTFLSCGTGDSMETVRALALGGSLAPGGGGDSQDCSLLEQYLSSVQQREAEEGGASDRTGTPQPPSPLSPAEMEQPDSNTQNNAQSEDTEQQQTLGGPI